MQVKLILSDSYKFFLRNFWQIGTLCFPFLLIEAFIDSLFANSDDFQFLSTISFLVLYPIYTAALIIFMTKSANKEHPGNREIIISSLKIWWPVFVLNVISVTLCLVGFLLLIAPGIWLVVRISFAEFFLVLYGLKPLEAISQSFKTTKQYFWFLLCLVILSIFGFWGLEYLIEPAINSFSNSSILFIATDSLISFIALFFDVVLFRLFMSADVNVSTA